ncbi:MAG: DUF1700 domain-containing protein [Lachnospiraceae bacterium]|nr:DUF1700 domain-containing protein [Lachnospiraceae bacterium]
MNRVEFLEGLNEALKGEVDPREYQDAIKYYSDYIEARMREGMSEEEVISSLGSPRLIAKSILQAQENKAKDSGRREETYENKTTRTEFDLGKGFRATQNEDGRVEFKYKKFNFNSWYGKLIFALVAIFIVVLLICVTFGVAYLAFTVLLPIALIAGIVYVIYRMLR